MWHFTTLMEDKKTMRAKPVTDDEQYRLIMECRSSGLTDCQWCLEHDIKPGTFYNWVKRLRKKGCCDIPPAGNSSKPVKQEIVKINFQEPSAPRPETEAISEPVLYPASELSEVPAIELFLSGVTVRIPQGTDAVFLEQVLKTLGRTLC